MKNILIKFFIDVAAKLLQFSKLSTKNRYLGYVLYMSKIHNCHLMFMLKNFLLDYYFIIKKNLFIVVFLVDNFENGNCVAETSVKKIIRICFITNLQLNKVKKLYK